MIRRGLRSLVGRLGAAGKASGAKQEVIELEGGLNARVLATKRGGMGVVYLCAINPDVDSPEVALKTFDEKFYFDPAMQAAFEMEARTWLVVSGAPFVLPLMRMIMGGKKPYLMMPAIMPNAHGDVSLADEIRRSPTGLGASRCLSLATQVAAGLTQCVRRVDGLVHGDLKPENILLFPDGSAMISDFGAARLASRLGPRDSAHGTSLYLSPECWTEPANTSAASDIYAFGATLFEALEGGVPFEPGDGDEQALFLMHRDTPPSFGRPSEGPLSDALRALSLECLAKNPGDRPQNMASIFERLVALGDEHDPITGLTSLISGHALRDLLNDPEAVRSRASSLLEQGDGENALRVLDQIPDDEAQDDLLRMRGNALSLAGRDEEALAVFERYLEIAPEGDDRTRCVNDMALSLKRLGRLAEARALYEDTIPRASREIQLMLRGNYAATLIELGEPARAANILRELTRQHPSSQEGWALLADAISRSSTSGEAIAAIQRAVELAPRNGNYRLMLGAFLMDGPKDVHAALEALDLAYGLGYHSREWMVRTLACNMLLDRREHVAELFAAIEQDLPDKEAVTIVREAAAMAAAIAGIAQEGLPAQPGREDGDGGAEEVVSTAPGEAVPALAEGSASDRTAPDYDEEEYRFQLRRGTRAHVQIRMSSVDSSTLFDFYYGVGQPDYTAVFAKTTAELKMHMLGNALGGGQRTKPFAFAQCPMCGVAMLTQRDPGERYLCQACGERVELAPAPSIAPEGLLLEALAAAGLEARATDEGTLFLGIVPNDPGQAASLEPILKQSGYERVGADALVNNMFAMQAHERGLDHPRDLEVWMRPLEAALSTAEDGTPEEVDRLLREIRRSAGNLLSMSMVIKDPQTVDLFLSTEHEMLDQMEAELGASPDGPGLARSFIETAIRLGRLTEATGQLARLRLAFPDDPDTQAAAGALAVAEGRLDEAIALLEEVLLARPRDHGARAQLAYACDGAGRTERAQELRDQLRSHGLLRSGGSDRGRGEPD